MIYCSQLRVQMYEDFLNLQIFCLKKMVQKRDLFFL